MRAFDESGRPEAPNHRIPASIARLHTAVPGRARLKVAGLQGSHSIKELLEQGGHAAPGVLNISASAVTGNIIVHFEPAVTLDSVVDYLTALLRGEIVAPGEMPDAGPDWHRLSAQRLSSTLEVSAKRGLSENDASRRLASTGPNILRKIPPRSGAEVLAEQFQSLPVAMLLGAASVSILTGGALEAAAILAVVGLNAVIGYQTESCAEQTIQSLGAQGPRTARIVREGATTTTPVREIVPGDVLVVRRGDVIPADARLIRAEALTVSEAMLTGESEPVAKTIKAVARINVPLGARANMIYRGTIVTGGSGRAIVVATGSLTQAGRIQRLVGATATPETPTQRELKDLGRRLGWLTLGACTFLVTVGWLRGFGFLQMARSALSVAVAAVPEGLPMVATTTLALGIEKLRRNDVFIRKLDAIETLAAARVICFDKTGTLTLGRISVATVRTNGKSYSVDDDMQSHMSGQSSLRNLLETCCLCNDTEIVRTGEGVHLAGSPTDSCLIEAALECGVDVASLRRRFARISVQHRTEAYRFMMTRHTVEDETIIAMKGSPQEVLARCGTELLPDGTESQLTPERRIAIGAENLQMASQALRVLGVARKRTGDSGPNGNDVRDLVWLGLIGMADQVRPGISALLAQLHAAGIQTIMLTGDQKATAVAVGERIGLNGRSELEIIDASELADMSSDELVRTARRARAFSRVSPSQKLQIVRSLQQAGVTVAMVGDGVNDGPALKAADVGIAIGQKSMNAAREIADVIINAGDLDGLIPGIETGRTTHRNIRKTIRYLVSTNLSEVLLVLAGTSIGMGTPLSPMQLLWINLISDVLPGIGLAMEAPEPDVLRRAPKDGDTAILRRKEIGSLAAQSAIITGGALASGLFGASRYGLDSPRTRTMTFASLVIAQLLHAITSRSATHGIFDRSPRRSNHALSLILGGSMALQTASMFIPLVRRLLGIAPIGVADVAVTLAGGTLPFLIMEWMKTRFGTIEGPLVWSREGGQKSLPLPV